MRGCVGFPSYLPIASITSDDGGWSTAYPSSNLLNQLYPSQIGQGAAAGNRTVTIGLSSAQSIQFLALINHNASAAQTPQFEFTLKLAGSTVYDSGVQAFGFPSPALPPTPTTPQIPAYIQNQPWLLASPVLADTVVIQLYAPAWKWSVGAVEIAAAYLWPDLSYPDMQRGFATTSVRVRQPGGVDYIMTQLVARMFSGARNAVALSELTTTVVDLQKDTKLSRPFVFVRDIDDQTCWPRECFLARNSKIEMPTSTNLAFGKHQIDLVEHYL